MWLKSSAVTLSSAHHFQSVPILHLVDQNLAQYYLEFYSRSTGQQYMSLKHYLYGWFLSKPVVKRD